MRAKYKFQAIQDAVMMLVLLSLTGYHLWGDRAHEWLGVLFFFIILLHCGLNAHWFKKLFQKEYTAFCILQISINALLLTLFFSAMTSGIMLSRYVLPDLAIHSSSDLARKIHMASVHWALLIIAAHLGMHWKMLANFFAATLKISSCSFLSTRVLPALFLLISTYGLYVFIQREMLSYLLIQVDFAFFDYEESKLVFYWDLFTVTIFFAYLTRFTLWLFIFRGHSTKNETKNI